MRMLLLYHLEWWVIPTIFGGCINGSCGIWPPILEANTRQVKPTTFGGYSPPLFLQCIWMAEQGQQFVPVARTTTSSMPSTARWEDSPCTNTCNDIWDLTALLLAEVCTNTKVEPQLQPLTGESLDRRSTNIQDNSRLDIKCRGFWQNCQDAFFDVRVFNPLASSNQNAPLSSISRQHEQEKRREYNQRIREVEQGSLVPLVFSASGSMGPSITIAYKRLTSLIA